MLKFLKAKFVKTAIWPKDYPILREPSGKQMVEVAVAGRSNVGKSSLLNHLFRSKGLVKTSSTPGKTQALNFFVADEELAFVDLPGYGYAKVPLHLRKEWGPMVQRYLEKRETLKLILFLFDIRRTPNEEDLQLVEWASYQQKKILLILTKVDKVKQNQKHANTQKILKAFGVNNDMDYIHYSVVKNIGRKELIYHLSERI